MQRLNKHFGRIIISAGITFVLIIYIYLNRHSIFGSFTHINLFFLVFVFIGEIGIQVANALVLKSTLSPLKIEIGYSESFRLTVVSSFVNFFTPIVGGASLKAVYLKRSHNISFPAFISVMYGNYLMFFISSFLLGLIAVLAIPGALSNHVGQLIAAFFASGILGSATFMLYGHKITRLLIRRSFKSKLLNSFIHKISLIDEGWTIIRRDTLSIYRMGLWSGVATLFVALAFWGSMKSINIHPSISATIVFAALSIVGLLFNITPGSVGIREAVYASIFTITAISPKQVVAFALIDRPAQLLVIGCGWILFSNRILRGIKQE